MCLNSALQKKAHEGGNATSASRAASGPVQFVHAACRETNSEFARDSLWYFIASVTERPLNPRVSRVSSGYGAGYTQERNNSPLSRFLTVVAPGSELAAGRNKRQNKWGGRKENFVFFEGIFYSPFEFGFPQASPGSQTPTD